VNYKQLIEVSAFSIVWETLIVGSASILLTVILGYFAGIEILAGFLMGLVTSGVLLSLFLANSGNSFESTKIAFEEGVNIDGEDVGTSSSAYQTSVINDKAGKQMKDVVSPTIMVVMKLVLITAIIISSALINRAQSKKGLHIQNLKKYEIPALKGLNDSNSNTYLM